MGRPHIARALMESGYVRSIQEAFDIYLRNDGKAYVPKFRFPPAEAIAMIRDVQGAPVLAHPFTLNLGSAFALKNTLAGAEGPGAGRHRGHLFGAHPGAGGPLPEAGRGAGAAGHRRLRLPWGKQAGTHPGDHALPDQGSPMSSLRPSRPGAAGSMGWPAKLHGSPYRVLQPNLLNFFP